MSKYLENKGSNKKDKEDEGRGELGSSYLYI